LTGYKYTSGLEKMIHQMISSSRIRGLCFISLISLATVSFSQTPTIESTAQASAEPTPSVPQSTPKSTAAVAEAKPQSPEPENPAIAEKPAISQQIQQETPDRGLEILGAASTGERVALSLDSIHVANRSIGFAQPRYFFRYLIGQETVEAYTACNGEFFTAKDGEFTNRVKPNSDATSRLVERVCSYLVKPAQVTQSSAEVRSQPNGSVFCTLQTSQTITTYGRSRDDQDWFYTDACGKLGMIHAAQIQR
jgi:hypothetical protein